ncbi:MAG TPA: oligosaccharide flippase family protein [Candidatus Nanoarchaeia archaeon]|nr:oligosaccharide flippase family protein [Candidatus Nanoarchaeia archaeon]
MEKKETLSSFSQEKQTIKEIFLKVKRRDFSGNEGLAIKNSLYQISTSTVSKIGSFIFTIIIARLLLPELFGLYALAFGTILFASNFADLATGQSFVKLIAAAKTKQLANSYLFYFVKIRIFLILITSIVLLASSYFIAHTYYDKPIFLALLSGPLYIIIISSIGIIDAFFYANNNFKIFLYKEIFLQVSRIIFVPLAILLMLSSSKETITFFIMLSLTLSNLIVLVFMFLKVKNKIDWKNKKVLPKRIKIRTNKFLFAMSSMLFSSLFFGYIDMIMLGRYVDASFIGFYRAAFGLLASATPLIAFSNVLFPIFNRLKGTRLEKALNKSKNFTIYLSFFSAIFAIIFAPIIVRITLGSSYTDSVILLRVLSVLLVLMPLISLYETYFISRNKPFLLAKLLIFSTILNIVLNYTLIKVLIIKSQLAAVIGVCVATIFARGLYLSFLLFFRKK